MDAIPEITVAEAARRYEVLLLDAYGVLVDADAALPGANEFVGWLNQSRIRYYVLTNDASRLPETIAARFQSFGLNIEADRVVSAGILLAPYFSAHGLRGAPCVVLGSAESLRYVELAGGRVVGPKDDFRAVVICDEAGFPFLETVDAVLTALFEKVEQGKRIPLLLPNPDLIYPKRHGFGIASGSIALVLEAALRLRFPDRQDLAFLRLGKPHPAIFAEAFRRSQTRSMVMIGDQLETDIQGARAFRLDSILVKTGVTAGSVSALPQPLRPTYLLHSILPPS